MISERIVFALLQGDWRLALALLGEGAAEDGTVRLAILLANAMYCCALGKLDEAWHYLSSAAGGVPDRTGTEEAGRTVWRFGLPPVGVTEPVAQLARVGWREQHALLGLRKRIRDSGGQHGRDVMVEAFCEHLTRIEHEPTTWGTVPPVPVRRSFGPVIVAPERKDFLARASAIRHFCDPFRGDVSRAVWDDAARYAGLRRLAYERLARCAVQAARAGEPQYVIPRRGFAEAERFALVVCPGMLGNDEVWRDRLEE